MCGIFGIFGHPEAANMTYLGLYALQHRGQEGAGIVSSDGRNLYSHKDTGLVADIFTADVIERLPGFAAIGHVRYSTTGESLIQNVQPIMVNYARGGMAVAHNGNLVNAATVRERLERRGSIFQSDTDTEIIVHLIARSRASSLVDRIVEALREVRGAFSLVFLTETRMVGVRDPYGFRPLILGYLKGAHILASETCALDLIGAEFVRELEPGELVLIDREGIRSFKPFEEVPHTPCIFEFIYFARPDSFIFGRNVYEVRKDLGRSLAEEHPADADMVIPVPDSGVPAAIGYSQTLGLSYEMGLIRSHYVGRTFIEPKQSIRHFGVKLKLNPVKDLLKGKRIVVVDDSIVRGTTSRKIVSMLKRGGAREVHMRIASPPTCYPCFYGIDTPTRCELIASSHSIDEIARYLGADSLGYLSIEGLMDAVGEGTYCKACFDGSYPVPFERSQEGDQMALFR